MASTQERAERIDRIRTLPADLTNLVGGLSDAQLAQHAADGWTIRQVVHHLADAHMNGFIRCKLAPTEDQPPVKPYKQELWSETADAHDLPVQHSLDILRGLHTRWVALWESLDENQWARIVAHPDRGLMTMDQQLILYSDHVAAHLNQIKAILAAPQAAT